MVALGLQTLRYDGRHVVDGGRAGGMTTHYLSYGGRRWAWGFERVTPSSYNAVSLKQVTGTPPEVSGGIT